MLGWVLSGYVEAPDENKMGHETTELDGLIGRGRHSEAVQAPVRADVMPER